MEVATTTALADFSAVYRCNEVGLLVTTVGEAGARTHSAVDVGAFVAGFHYEIDSILGNKYAGNRHIY